METRQRIILDKDIKVYINGKRKFSLFGYNWKVDDYGVLCLRKPLDKKDIINIVGGRPILYAYKTKGFKSNPYFQEL